MDWSICLHLRKDVLDAVTPKVKELAQGLDTYRHQIKLVEINEFKNEDADELIRSFEMNAILCKEVETEKLHEVMKTAHIVSEVDRRTSSQIKMMEEYVSCFLNFFNS